MKTYAPWIIAFHLSFWVRLGKIQPESCGFMVLWRVFFIARIDVSTTRPGTLAFRTQMLSASASTWRTEISYLLPQKSSTKPRRRFLTQATMSQRSVACIGVLHFLLFFIYEVSFSYVPSAFCLCGTNFRIDVTCNILRNAHSGSPSEALCFRSWVITCLTAFASFFICLI